jgi:hypothetical protein
VNFSSDASVVCHSEGATKSMKIVILRERKRPKNLRINVGREKLFRVHEYKRFKAQGVFMRKS